MQKDPRSHCPINLSLEVFGDRWTLLVLRDVAFGGSRFFGELLRGQEGISSSILSDRLNVLVANGLLTRSDDPTHRQKVRYSLTEASIELVPILAQLSAWGVRHLPADPVTRADALMAGGPALVEQFLDELREEHLGPHTRHSPAPLGPTAHEQVEDAWTRSQARPSTP